MEPRVYKDSNGMTTMEFGLRLEYRQPCLLIFEVFAVDFWSKLKYFFGIGKPRDVLAEIESCIVNGDGNVEPLELYASSRLFGTSFKGYGRTYKGDTIIRIMIPKLSCKKYSWNMSFKSLDHS